MTERILQEHREIWQQKPVLRAIYTDFYQRITSACRPGRTLEIGGGTGNLKEYLSRVISTDILPTGWLDAAADAQELPFTELSFANIVGVDVLHHIERPIRFFEESFRVLKPGGRIILIEPAITPLSWVFYKLFHPEPVVMKADPFSEKVVDPNRLPFDANQAIPTLLFHRYRYRLLEMFRDITNIKIEYFSLVAYPLSGGFRSWCIIPFSMVDSLLHIDNLLCNLVGRQIAFRLFIVIDKN